MPVKLHYSQLMIRDMQSSDKMRAAVNKAIAASNDDACAQVKEIGAYILSTYFADGVVYGEDEDVLDALYHVFREHGLESELSIVASLINALSDLFVLPPGDTHFLHFVNDGKYQEKQREAAYRHIQKWGQALDIGGHVGFWANGLAKHFDVVHSFEPNPETFKCLIQNKSENVIAHCCGLGSVDEKMFLSYPSGDGTTEPENSGGWEVDDNMTKGTYPINVRRLDSFSLEADFIKIDVQGYELHVLKGARETIIKHHPVILVELISSEVTNDEAIDFIENDLGMIRKEVINKDFVYGW